MASINFDTYRAVNLLKERGYTKKQAEGFIQVMQEVTLLGVAAKEDIDDLRTELKEDINGLPTELKEDINDLRTELKADIQGLAIRVEKIEARLEELKSYITARIYVGQAMAVVAVIGALKLFAMI